MLIAGVAGIDSVGNGARATASIAGKSLEGVAGVRFCCFVAAVHFCIDNTMLQG